MIDPIAFEKETKALRTEFRELDRLFCPISKEHTLGCMSALKQRLAKHEQLDFATMHTALCMTMSLFALQWDIAIELAIQSEVWDEEKLRHCNLRKEEVFDLPLVSRCGVTFEEDVIRPRENTDLKKSQATSLKGPIPNTPFPIAFRTHHFSRMWILDANLVRREIWTQQLQYATTGWAKRERELVTVLKTPTLPQDEQVRQFEEAVRSLANESHVSPRLYVASFTHRKLDDKEYFVTLLDELGKEFEAKWNTEQQKTAQFYFDYWCWRLHEKLHHLKLRVPQRILNSYLNQLGNMVEAHTGCRPQSIEKHRKTLSSNVLAGETVPPEISAQLVQFQVFPL